jgi:hypothetical protein
MAKNYGGRSEKGMGGYKSPGEGGKASGGNRQSGRENGSMPSGDMAMAGLNQGDMNPRIKNYQKPTKDFSQEGFSKTLDYIERQDKFQGTEASTVEKQAYEGRYS